MSENGSNLIQRKNVDIDRNNYLPPTTDTPGTEDSFTTDTLGTEDSFVFRHRLKIYAFLILICITGMILCSVFLVEKPTIKVTHTVKVKKSSKYKYGDQTLSGRIFTKEELKLHDSKASKIYLAIMGRVYDVTKGQAYHDGSSYPFFAGIDGSRAFMTGDFTNEGLIDDISGLDALSMLDLKDWVENYDKEYTYLGDLIGNFYNEDGTPTQALKNAEKLLVKAYKEKADNQADKIKFPPCNSRYNKDEGLWVWCSNDSGGIRRSWSGLPRRYFDPTSKNWRCACVNDNLLNSPKIKVYSGCNDKFIECKVQE